ncbi:MAG TPA: methyltransferase domain-containing protein [Kofleriaceae bacterium]|nr:methyltransferase domain-containing protein [Kofleriaceae bacterium]
MKDAHGRNYWERHAKRYDRATRFLSRPVPRMLALSVDAARGKRRVLEVAAGTGLLTVAIAPVVGELVATDYANEMLAHVAARARDEKLANVHVAQADIAALTFSAASFDAVFAANVLHLVPDLDAALASLRGVLRPGGVLVAPTYLHDETFVARTLARLFRLTGFPSCRRFTTQSLRAAISSAGFRITRSETISGPFPVGFVEAVRVDAKDCNDDL